MMLTNLADMLRAAGMKVEEVPGWKTRGHGQMTDVDAIVCHHTAGPKTGNYPSLSVVRDGRPDLDGPLAQLGLGRDGTVFVIAAGVCYHAGVVFETWQDNWHAIGIEAEGTGVDPWPTVQYQAYAHLVAALRRAYGVPNDRVVGHKEIAKPKGRKSDPNFDMASFRSAVNLAYTGMTKPPTDTTEDEMTPAQMIELKNFIEARTKAYAIANNNYTRQVLSSTAKALVAADQASDKAQADRILAELDQQSEALSAESIEAVPTAVEA